MAKVLAPPQIVLMTLAAGGEDTALDPVRIQHMLFLLDRQIPDWLGGPHFAFVPGPFGPFAERVKEVLQKLCHEGYIHIQATRDYAHYVLTDRGFAQGSDTLSDLEFEVRSYLEEVVTWVCTLDFRERLATFQAHFPDMVVDRNVATTDRFRSDSVRQRLVTDHPHHSASHAFFMALARLGDLTGTLGSDDRTRRTRRKSQYESISPEGVWASVGDRLREAMALHACDVSRPLSNHDKFRTG